MLNKKLLWGLSTVLLVAATLGKVYAEEEEIDNTITKTIQVCVEAKRGKEYEIARENVLKKGKELLAILSDEPEDISAREWVVRQALKVWVEKPDVAYEFYKKITKEENSTNILGPFPSTTSVEYACVELGDRNVVLPLMYEILLKGQRHPEIFNGILSAIGWRNFPTNKRIIPVILELARVEEFLEDGKKHYVVNGLVGKEKYNIPEDAILGVPLSAIWAVGSLAQKHGDSTYLQSLKELYRKSSHLPLKAKRRNGGTKEYQKVYKQQIIEALEKIGQSDGVMIFEELEKLENNEELRKELAEAKQKVIEKIKEQKKKEDEQKNKSEDKQPPKKDK